mgnify:CR=1 FL=1
MLYIRIKNIIEGINLIEVGKICGILFSNINEKLDNSEFSTVINLIIGFLNIPFGFLYLFCVSIGVLIILGGFNE